jgi:hypothetical protein
VITGLFLDRGLGAYQIWRNNLAPAGEPPADFDAGDTDGDGVSNAMEYYLGYDPLSAVDTPALHYALFHGSFVVTASCRTLGPGMNLQFEASQDLVSWSPVNPQVNYSIANGRIQAISWQIPAVNSGARFFRMRPVWQ